MYLSHGLPCWHLVLFFMTLAIIFLFFVSPHAQHCNEENTSYTCRPLNSKHYTKLNEYLSAINWSFITDNSGSNGHYDVLSYKLICGLNLITPVKSVKNLKKLYDKPRHTPAITVGYRIKHKLYKNVCADRNNKKTIQHL